MADKSSRKFPDYNSYTPTCFNFFRKILPLILKNKKENNSGLPLELESNILQRIPVKPLLRLQCVCKDWRDEIKSPSFVKSHTGQFQNHNANSTSLILFRNGVLQSNLYSLNYRNSTLEFKKLATHYGTCDVVGSCNGLLCLRKINYNNNRQIRTVRFSLHNPVTGTKVNNIPHLVVVPNDDGNYNNVTRLNFYAVGFGYDCINDDYKIFYSIRYDNHDLENTGKAWVYSLKRNLWKNIQPLPRGYSRNIKMINSNNLSYWISQKPYNKHCVSGFDFETEEYHDEVVMVPVPLPGHNDESSYSYKLVDLRGFLYLVTYDSNWYRYTMSIWVLKKNRLWVKLIHRLSLKQAVETELVRNRCIRPTSVYSYEPPLPYAFSEDESEMLIGLGKPIKAFVCCDLRSGKLKPLRMSGVPDDWNYGYQGMSWTGSLVSISNSTSL